MTWLNTTPKDLTKTTKNSNKNKKVTFELRMVFWRVMVARFDNHHWISLCRQALQINLLCFQFIRNFRLSDEPIRNQRSPPFVPLNKHLRSFVWVHWPRHQEPHQCWVTTLLQRNEIETKICITLVYTYWNCVFLFLVLLFLFLFFTHLCGTSELLDRFPHLGQSNFMVAIHFTPKKQMFFFFSPMGLKFQSFEDLTMGIEIGF